MTSILSCALRANPLAHLRYQAFGCWSTLGFPCGRRGFCPFWRYSSYFIYAQTLGFSFLNYDDDAYVTANTYVVNGLAADSIQWAFTSFSRFYWHPSYLAVT